MPSQDSKHTARSARMAAPGPRPGDGAALAAERSSWLFFLKAYPRQTATMVVFLLFAGVVESVGAVSLVPLLAGLFDGGPGGGPLMARIGSALALAGLPATLSSVLVVICVAMALKGLLTLLAFRQTGYVEIEVTTRLRADLLDALLRARWPYFVTQPAGALTYALSTETAQAGVALRSYCQILSHLFQALAYLMAGLFLSWEVMLAALVCGGVFLLAFRGLIRSVRHAGLHQSDALNAMASFFTDSLAGVKPLKAMGAADSFMDFIRGQSTRYEQTARRHIMGSGLLSCAQEPALTILLAAGLYWSKTALRIDGATVLAMAFFFQRIVSRFSSAQQGLQTYAALEGLLLSLLRKIAELNANREAEGDNARVTLSREARLESVSLAYNGRPVLSGCDIAVPMGAITALCGPSGSGKSTVADMLTGLVLPESGQVLIDGVPLPNLDLAHWRAQVGYVPQEVFLFNDTVRNNITMGRPLSDEQVWDALRRAGALSFLEGAGGLDMVVGEQGRGLSGGQRQRLMIARAIAGRPRLLILDEATTGLDEQTEREILDALALIKTDMAILAISHQEAVRSVADTIYTFGPGHGPKA